MLLGINVAKSGVNAAITWINVTIKGIDAAIIVINVVIINLDKKNKKVGKNNLHLELSIPKLFKRKKRKRRKK